MEINNKISAIVTGGASGLGEATARRLAANGAKVALFDMNDERGEKVAAEIGGVFCHVDVSDEESVDAGLAKARAAHGQERVLVNCAGIVIGRKTVSRDRETGDILAHDLKSFAKVVEVNLIGTFHMIAKCAAGMAATEPVTKDGGRGVIINTASIAGAEGQIGQAAYAASKGGVIGATLPIARDLAREGIRCCSIMPGLFYTPMFDTLPKEAQDALGATVPFPTRLGEADEFAQLAQQIVENDMLNGTCIRLDGAIRLEPR